MLILIILLSVLLVGLVSFVAGQLWEQRVKQPAATASLLSEPRSRSCITTELDELLLFYQQGLITEEQYASSTDKLVDELAALLTEESPPVPQ